MVDTDYEQQMIQIELILQEADRHGLRWEVQQTAQRMMEENPELNAVLAHEYALLDWDCV